MGNEVFISENLIIWRVRNMGIVLSKLLIICGKLFGDIRKDVML